ncbi:MAG: protein kinase [Myxococcales bacterium]|nr:protein kinase [Myxococcales bacterium]
MEARDQRSDSRERVVGSYALKRRLGSGAMGEVWLGWHQNTESLAAIKLLRQDPALRGRARRFFDRERRIIGRLSHPNIVGLYEVGPTHIAMAYVDGPNLAQRVMNGIEPRQALSYALQIASALSHAHDVGVVHRDVKPGNILLDSRGNAFLADFGLATLVEEDNEARSMRAGTPGYMPPEQHRGAGVGPAADQFALGRTLLEMLAGGPVSPHIDQAVLQLPAGTPAELVTILKRACAPEAIDRFRSMDDFSHALGSVSPEGNAPPLRLAAELRVRAPFAWCSAATRTLQVSHDVARADYTLGAIEQAGVLPAGAAAGLLADAGLSELGFSLYAHESRLGSVADSAMLARASDVVVLVHGSLCTRSVWSAVAANICRNNPLAVVLVPDVLGSGESKWSPTAPPGSASTQRLVRTLVAWLELLGVRELPTVLLAHSAAATALLGVTDDDLGERTTRVAVTPIFPSTLAPLRVALHVTALLLETFGRFSLIKRWLGWASFMFGPATRGYTVVERERMLHQFLALPAPALAELCRSLARAKPEPSDRLDRCAIVVSTDDPVAPEAHVRKTLDALGFPPRSIHTITGAGHMPQFQSEEHPEWTLRNVDDLVRIAESMLVSAREGDPSSTVVASTVLESTGDASAPSGPPQKPAEAGVQASAGQ